MQVRQCVTVMNKNTEISINTLSRGATPPEGFVAGGVVCGVRNSGRRDLGLLFSEHECTSAAVFTRNAVKGAPLVVTREASKAETCERSSPTADTLMLRQDGGDWRMRTECRR